MDTVNFTILDSNLEANSIVVRPYSSDFKYPPEAYAPYNINFTNLNPNYDIGVQIANYMQPIIQSILRDEADKSEYTTIASQLTSLSANQMQSVPVSTMQLVNLEMETNLASISTPASALQFQSDMVVNYQLQQTFSNMTSTLLLSGVEFIV
jgi:hypothetical protein